MDREGLKLEIELLETKSKKHPSPQNLAKHNVDVLIVIHTNEIRSQLLEIVKTHYSQCNVRYSSDVLEAYVKLKHRPADLVICEFALPYMSGFDFMIKMKSNSGLKDIPVILISSQPLHGVIDSQVPVVVYPFDIQDLTLKLNENLIIREGPT